MSSSPLPLLCLALFLAASCDFSLPSGARVTCSDDTQCPAGSVCQPAAGRCMTREVADRYTLPQLALVGVSPQRASRGVPVEVLLRRSGAITALPDLSLEHLASGDVVVAAVEGCDAEGLCRATAPGFAEDNDHGGWAVFGAVVDDFGVRFGPTVLGSLDVDVTAPSLVTDATVEIEAPPGALVLLPAAATEGSIVRVSFALSEPVTTAPSVTAVFEGGTLDLNATSTSESVLTFSLEIPSAPRPGTWNVRVAATDVAGNIAVLEDIASFEVDPLPPAPPATTTAGAIKYHRVPWGSDETGGEPRFFVTATPGSLEPFAALAIYESPAGTPLAFAFADAAGAVNADDLLLSPPVDRPSVFVRSYDLAGNASPVVPVLDVAWTASLGGKVPGSIEENPHRLAVRRVFRDARVDEDEEETPTPVPVENAGGAVLVASSAGSWERASVDPLDQSYLADAGWWFDSHRGEITLSVPGYESDRETWRLVSDRFELSAQQPGLVQETSSGTPTFDERRGVAVMLVQNPQGQVVVQEFKDDRWSKAMTITDQAVAAGAAPTLSLYSSTTVYDPATGEILFVSYDDLLWAWNGTRFTALGPIDPEGDGSPFTSASVLAAPDLSRRRVVYFGGAEATDACERRSASGQYCGDTWEWDGAAFHPIATTDPEGDGDPAPRVRASMGFDAARGVILLYGGQNDDEGTCDGLRRTADATCFLGDLWAFNGTSWRRLDEGALAPGRPRPRVDAPPALVDRARGGLVLFAGTAAYQEDDLCPDGSQAYGGCSLGDVWRWDGEWIPLTSDVVESRLRSPEGRSFHGVATGDGEAYLFGGSSYDTYAVFTGSESSSTDDGFEDYVFLCADGEELTCAGCFLSDVWRKRDPGWEQLSTGAIPGRAGAAVTWLGDEGSLFVFGGGVAPACDVPPPPDGVADAGVVLDAGTPPDNAEPAVRCASGHRAVTYDDCAVAEVWTFDGSEFTFRAATGPAPHPRGGAAIAYDALGGRVVIYGGRSEAIDEDEPCLDGTRSVFGECVYGDTWSWRDDVWNRIALDDPEFDGDPGPRMGAGMAFDASRGVVVLFGGVTRDGACGPGFCKDVWELAGTSWRRIEPTDPEGDRRPGGRKDVSLVYDPSLQRVLIVGGVDDDREKLADVWTWDGTSFALVGVADPEHDGEPEALSLPLVLESSTGVLHSIVNGPDEETAASWRFLRGRNERAAFVFDVDFASASTFGRAQLSRVSIHAVAGGDGTSTSGAPRPGAEALLFAAGFHRIAGNEAAASEPSTLTDDVADPTILRDALVDDHLTVAVASTGVDGAAASPARVAMDYIAIKVDYRFDETGGGLPCGGVPASGFCDGERAVWCEAGVLREQACADGAGEGTCLAGRCIQQPPGATCDRERLLCADAFPCVVDATGSGTCRSIPSDWTCNPEYFASGDGCDCGCGVIDPDCGSSSSTVCDFCDSAGSCNALPGCPGDVLPYDNEQCSSCGDGVVEGSELCDLDDPTICDARCRYVVPDSWTCSRGFYGTDDGCDCGCGAIDPDCGPSPSLSRCEYCGFGCAQTASGSSACGAINELDIGACAAWTCDESAFQDGVVCDCGCGIPDPDCATATPDACARCGPGSCSVDETCAGLDAVYASKCSACGNGIPEGTEECDAPGSTTCDGDCNLITVLPEIPGWTCPTTFYGADDGCDCGCGLLDPDCADPTIASCDYCFGCGTEVLDCREALDPTDNSQCI